LRITWRSIIGGTAPNDSFRVDFFIAGVQRGGTFSLYRLLGRHREIGVSRYKEVHFFDDEMRVDWSNPTYDDYHRHFRRNRRCRVFGEATPIYIYWPESLARICAYNPDAKLILLFRDPIERAYSAWCRQRRNQRETLSFAEAIRDGRARVAADAHGFGNRHFSYVERGMYAKQLTRALEYFPASSILSLNSRDLSTDPSALVQEVAGFLDLTKPSHVIKAVHANRRPISSSSDPIEEDDVALLADIFAGDVADFAKLINFSTEDWPIMQLIRGKASAADIAARLMQPGFATE
jgi:hypothetical protein